MKRMMTRAQPTASSCARTTTLALNLGRALFRDRGRVMKETRHIHGLTCDSTRARELQELGEQEQKESWFAYGRFCAHW